MKIKRGEFVSLGDIHLEKLNNLFGSQGNAYIFQAIQNAVDYCKENGVKVIVSGGDMFDNPNPSQQAIAGLLRLVIANPSITFAFMLGNHDIESKLKNSSILIDFIASTKLIKNLKVYMVPTYEEIYGMPFYFMPWPHFKQIDRQPHPCINIAHLRLSGAIADNGRVMKEGEAEIEEGLDYWVVWDLHKHQKLGKRVIYPGTMLQYTFGEPLPKGILHSEVAWGNKLKVEHKYIQMEPPFRLINLEINRVKDFDQVETNLNYRYKLFVKQGLALPTNFLLKHPNVIDAKEFKTKTDLIALQNDTVVIEEVAGLNVKKVAMLNLTDFLEQKGFSRDKVNRARHIVKNIIEQTAS